MSNQKSTGGSSDKTYAVALSSQTKDSSSGSTLYTVKVGTVLRRSPSSLRIASPSRLARSSSTPQQATTCTTSIRLTPIRITM